MRLNAWASDAHYAAHLAPVWIALPPERRGRFYLLSGPRVPPQLVGLDDVEVSRDRPHGPDPVLVASYVDYLGVTPAPVIFIEHGAGQTYDGDHSANPCYAGGSDRDRVALFLCPNTEVAARNTARYPATPAAVVGAPHLDVYHSDSGVGEWSPRRPHKPKIAGSNPVTATTGADSREGDQAASESRLHFPPPRLAGPGEGGGRPAFPGPIVCVSFHWDWLDGPPEGRSAFPYYEPVLADVARAFPGALGHAHPRWYLQVVAPMARAGLQATRYFDEVMEKADLYVCDTSSTLYEFASTGRPVVLLNAPWYRRDVELGRRFWRDADVGLQVNEPSQLVDTIAQALTDPPEAAENRRSAVARVYSHTDGLASARAAEAIVRRLDELTEATDARDR